MFPDDDMQMLTDSRLRHLDADDDESFVLVLTHCSRIVLLIAMEFHGGLFCFLIRNVFFIAFVGDGALASCSEWCTVTNAVDVCADRRVAGCLSVEFSRACESAVF